MTQVDFYSAPKSFSTEKWIAAGMGILFGTIVLASIAVAAHLRRPAEIVAERPLAATAAPAPVVTPLAAPTAQVPAPAAAPKVASVAPMVAAPTTRADRSRKHHKHAHKIAASSAKRNRAIAARHHKRQDALDKLLAN